MLYALILVCDAHAQATDLGGDVGSGTDSSRGNGVQWKALVLAFNTTRKIVTVQFFVKDHDKIWIPENSPAQDVHLNGVLGIDPNGNWANCYTHWEEFQD